MSKGWLKVYAYGVALVGFFVLVFGLVAPSLISAPSTEAAVFGLAVILCSVVLLAWIAQKLWESFLEATQQKENEHE